MLRSEEVLSICGSFEGSWCRARLTFYPCPNSDRHIGGKPYRKVSYETGQTIPGCLKLLDLPGEQHFLVHRSQIRRIYRPMDAFAGLQGEIAEQCERLVTLFEVSCRVAREHHGLTGSGALHALSANSDFDWIIYERNPSKMETYVRGNERFPPEFTFPMAHVYRKYAIFEGLQPEDIDALFLSRWKYFRFGDLRVSLSFVDPHFKADAFLWRSSLGKQVLLRGEVQNPTGCYHMPRLLPINCGKRVSHVLTWLFLYGGAFKKGDVVEVRGRKCQLGHSRFVLVESPSDYIRKVR